jgi:hypothetical protein
VGISGELVTLTEGQDNADLAPTPSMLAAYSNVCVDLKSVLSRWKTVTTTDLNALDAVLARGGRSPVAAPKSTLAAPGC